MLKLHICRKPHYLQKNNNTVKEQVNEKEDVQTRQKAIDASSGLDLV